LIFYAVERIVAAGNFKRYTPLTQNGPREYIHGHRGVHARIRTKGVKTLFYICIHADAQGCLGHIELLSYFIDTLYTNATIYQDSYNGKY
jgi:hypothetical protein